MTDIEQVLAAERLRLRVYPDAAHASVQDALLSRPLAAGLVETVVIDYPDSLVVLNRAEIGNRPEEAIFGAALAWSIGKEPYEVPAQPVEGVPTMLVAGDHPYVGSHVHVLSRYLDPGSAPLGALVAFPAAECVTVHRIGDAYLFDAFQVVSALAGWQLSRSEKPISPQVYWWRPGRYEQLPETEALGSGLVPDLRPLFLRIDESGVHAQAGDTGELIELWIRTHGVQRH